MAKKSKKTLMIIDGHALLHRAWHALPPLTTKDGTLVHGAYGFTTILLGAIKELSPGFVAVTLDPRAPTFRHEEYAEYKATREKKPEELYAQVGIIRRILDAMGIPVYMKDGFEADDMIGTLTAKTREEDADVRVVIVTGDLDTLQLVDSRVSVFTIRKGISDTFTYDKKAVTERFGLGPEQMIDYKALRGDQSDNIPGVRGIGEKTAIELLKEFGTLDKLYESLDKDDAKATKIRPAVRAALIAHRDDAFIARRLVTIRRDVPVDFSLKDCVFRGITREQVAPVFESLQFMKLLQKLPRELVEDAAQLPGLFDAKEEPRQEELVDAGAGLQILQKAKRIAFRTVLIHDDPRTPELRWVGITDGATTVVIDGADCGKHAAALAAIFEGKVEKVCHDLKQELLAARAFGRTLTGPLRDIMLSSYLLYAGERRHSLDAILAFYRNFPPAVEGDGRNRFAAELSAMLPVEKELAKELASFNLEKLLRDIEIPTAGVLADMEWNGIAVDVAYLSGLSKEFGEKLNVLVAKIHKVAGGEFNINSPAQLKTVLFERLNVATTGIRRTAKGSGLSTAASELEKLRGAHPIVDSILAYRELSKLKSTYVDAIPGLVSAKTGRIHADFNQTVAATGRLSSSNPNMQNIPTADTEYGRRVRNAFIAGRGRVLFAADYSQIELRIAAHIANEKAMTAAFKKGEDIHFRTAAEMFGEAEAKEKRRVAKVINFGILYGMGAQRLAETAGISFAEAQDYIARYFSVYSGIAKYIDDTKEQLKSKGYVETLFGRKRFFRNYAVMNRREQAEAERQAINLPIQGTQADIIKIAAISLREKLAKFGDKVLLVAQVHDELVFEIEKRSLAAAAAIIIPVMETTVKLSVPVVVDAATGERWGEMEEFVA